MKPLIIVQFDPYVDIKNVEQFEKVLNEQVQIGGALEGYNAIVVQGDAKFSVHYPCKPISYYFNKIKAWVFLKIVKRKQSSNTSVIM